MKNFVIGIIVLKKNYKAPKKEITVEISGFMFGTCKRIQQNGIIFSGMNDQQIIDF